MPDKIFNALLQHKTTKKLKTKKFRAVTITEASTYLDLVPNADYECIAITLKGRKKEILGSMGIV